MTRRVAVAMRVRRPASGWVMQTVFPSADTAMPAGAFGSERMCSDRAAIGWTPGTAAKRGIVTMRRVLKGR